MRRSPLSPIVRHLERVWFLIIGSRPFRSGGDDLAESKRVKQINNPTLNADLESRREDRKSCKQRRIQATNGMVGLLLVVVMEAGMEMNWLLKKTIPKEAR